MTRLLIISRNYWLWMIIALVAMLGVTAATLAGPWLIRSLINTIEEGVIYGTASKSQIINISLMLLLIHIFRPTLRALQVWAAHVAGWGSVAAARKVLYEHLQRLSPKYYASTQTGEIMSRAIHDTSHFETLIAHVIPEAIVSLLTVLGVFIVLFSINVKSAVYTLIPIPLIILTFIFYNRYVRPLFRYAQARLGDLNATLHDNLSGIREIQGFTQEEREAEFIGERIMIHSLAITKAVSISACFHGGIDFFAGLGTVLVILIGGLMALKGQMSIADITGFLLYITSLYEPVTRLNQLNESLQQSLAASDRFFEVLNTEPDIHDTPNAIELKKVKGYIAFVDVDFNYGEDPVLKNINLNIQPGETIALVGPTGVGKTTMANLIPRFYDPNSGSILIDGTDIRNVSLTSLRSHISMVLQDVFLFTGTIAENIAYGSPDATLEQIIKAAVAAEADDFIREMPNGYDTHIGERGVRLSGGQKQRLAIARALLYNAPILILDEATSAVDTKTEAKIAAALERLMVGRTTIVIAHRLSTIRHADRIIVLDKGKIAEEGTHEELMNLGGLYTKLVTVNVSTELSGVRRTP